MKDINRFAGPGTVWVCSACGKTAKDRYGDSGTSWDESCMLNAVLCHDKRVFTDEGLTWQPVAMMPVPDPQQTP